MLELGIFKLPVFYEEFFEPGPGDELGIGILLAKHDDLVKNGAQCPSSANDFQLQGWLVEDLGELVFLSDLLDQSGSRDNPILVLIEGLKNRAHELKILQV